jgi:hypothetical protein
MTDIKSQPNANNRREETKPEQADQQAQQSQANSAAQPIQRASPGRRPLFRT